MPVPLICLTLDTLGHCAEAIKRQKGNEHVPRTELAQVLYDYCMDHGITKIGPRYLNLEGCHQSSYLWWVRATLQELDSVGEISIPIPERQTTSDFVHRWLQNPLIPCAPRDPVWDRVGQVADYQDRMRYGQCYHFITLLNDLTTQRAPWVLSHLSKRDQLGVRLLHALHEHLPPVASPETAG